MVVELKVPQAGESITEVQIGEWLVAEGEHVSRDQSVAEIETDKASMELPAPVAGRLTRRVKQAGEFAKVGETIALIEPAGDGASTKVASAATGKKEKKERDRDAGKEPSHVMPAARRALAQHDLKASEVRPSGPGGRLLKEDVERHVEELGAQTEDRSPDTEDRGSESRKSESEQSKSSTSSTAAGAAARPAFVEGNGDRAEEVVPMTMLRRRIAERLVQSQQTAALLTTFNEVDMSAVMELRRQRGDAFEKKYGIRLGFMSFFVKAVIDALKLVPQVNAEIRGTDIVYKNYYDIGVAVSTEAGLVVPVLRSAERMSFAQVELAIAELAQRARDRKLSIEDLQGGTFTISNGGVFGSLMSTPIVNPPQVGILGLHAIQDRPVARDGAVVIRPMMYVALTYDHRIIDGRESVTFLKRIRECVEDPARMLIEV